MKIYAPDYYPLFRCSAGACRHTCCVGWEIDVDEESVRRFRAMPETAPYLDEDGAPHIRLMEGERCPFLNREQLCDLQLRYGEGVLCQICRDHPRFRNFWSDRTEIGLGLVCEEAGKLILSQTQPMKLVQISGDDSGALPEDEAWLMDLRQHLWQEIPESGPQARLQEYLIFRHLPDALYDGRLEERIAFIRRSYEELMAAWAETDGSLASLVECCREWSYRVEYDDEELENRLSEAL